jgi:fumarylpyruvate hydrolase
MNAAIPLWDIPSVPIAGTSQRFPVRHIYCVGRNYAEHAKEMGGDATKEPPFFFTKAADSIVPVVAPEVGRIRYPMATSELPSRDGAGGRDRQSRGQCRRRGTRTTTCSAMPSAST